MAVLEIKDLHVKVDGDKEILKGINLTVHPGELHAIMGRNGSGKSTLAHVLSGREGYEVTEGRVLLDGEDLLEMEIEERAAAGVFLAFGIVAWFLLLLLSFLISRFPVLSCSGIGPSGVTFFWTFFPDLFSDKKS